MNTVSTSHHTLVVTRQYPVARARVFAAWREANALVRWYTPGDSGWSSKIVAHDFRVGGVKQITFGPTGGDTFTEDCRYEDIVPDQRICFSMTISRAAQRITTSMVTVLLTDHAEATKLCVTDQLVILDGGDTSADRERGWGETLDKLPKVL